MERGGEGEIIADEDLYIEKVLDPSAFLWILGTPC